MIRDNTYNKYKSSPIGIIPEDWEVKRLGDFSTFFSGGTPKSGNPLFYNGNIPFIRSGEIECDKTEMFLSKEGLSKSSAKVVEKGDILYALYGANSGQCAISKINGAINQAILCIRPNAERYYILSVLQLNKDLYYNSYLQGGQGNLSADIVSNYKIALPPLAEQKRICNLLSLWDTAIAKQTALIEKLTLRKRGLMQQLLTGKKRLKGFSGEWGYHKIQDHFTEIRDKNDGKGHIPMTISAKVGLVSQTHKFDRIVAGNSLDKYTLLHKGDFAYNKGNSNLYEMGCIYRLKEESAVVPFVYICFRVVDDTCCEFYQQFFINHGLDKQLKQIITSGARGDGLLNVNSEDFMALKIPYPPIKEQQAIASILNNADKEIELANKKLARLQEEKKGLMQVLLTGRKRINK